MKNSFKYTILLLLLSFLISTLCCNSRDIFERYTGYPFASDTDNNLHSLDNIQKTLFKYNSVVSGVNNYDIPTVVKGINSDRQNIKYKRLLDGQQNYGNYYPFDARILSDDFQMKNTPSKIKGTQIITDPDKKTDSLLAQSLEPQVLGMLDSTKPIKERDYRGNFYNENNSCIGQWSDWNSDTCGTDRNRCGIMFKKYEILEKEKNDENGVGKPCESKDGIMKYKYCFGEQADDYESNMERCDMSENLCACKLKNGTFLEGDNVYDLENEDCLFELERQCICPKGYTNIYKGDICQLTPGVDCSVSEPGCVYTAPATGVEESCKIPSFLNQAQEDEFYSNYDTYDGKCKQKVCYCPNGTVPSNSDACLIDGQIVCDPTIPCERGYYMSGSPPTCKAYSGDDNLECSCLHGEPSTPSPGRCTATDTDGYLSEPVPKQLQHCKAIGCAEGYRYATSDEVCGLYYPNDTNTGFFLSGEQGSCCIPDFDTCMLEETDLEEQNIVRKDPSNLYSTLIHENMNKLIERHNGLDVSDPITADELLDEDEPKNYIISKILELTDVADGDNSICSGDIFIKDCYSEFKCKPGYAFSPSTEHVSENELMISGCGIKSSDPLVDICEPVINCLNPNATPFYVSGGTVGYLEFKNANDNDCYFSQDVAASGKIMHPVDVDTPLFALPDTVTGIVNSGSVCGTPQFMPGVAPSCENSTNCQYRPQQSQQHYPIWNGTCVPVSCSISEEIKNIYGITNDNCPSGNINCGISNITCKNDSFEVPNTRRMLYCPSPQKIDSAHPTPDYEIVAIGCSTDPPARSTAQEIRRKMMASAGEIIAGDDEQQAAARQGPNPDLIGEAASFIGSTSEQQLNLEVGLEESRLLAEEQASAVGGGTNINASNRLASYSTSGTR